MSDKIDIDRWMAAEEATEYRRSQVQGFLYGERGTANSCRAGLHVIRDLTLPPGKQIVWQRDADDDAYEDAHAEMTKQAKVYRLKLIAKAYTDRPSPAQEISP